MSGNDTTLTLSIEPEFTLNYVPWLLVEAKKPLPALEPSFNNTDKIIPK